MLIAWLVSASSASAEGLEVKAAPPRQAWPITLGVQLGSLGFYPQDANPSVSVGTEYSLRRGSISELAVAANLGSVFYRANLVGGLIEVAAVNRWRARFGLYAEVTVGAGYQLTFVPGTTYVARGDAFVTGGNSPTSMLRARVAVGPGFDFGALGWRAVRITAQYSAFVLTPYAPGNGIPVMVGAQATIAVSVPLDLAAGAP